MKNTLNHLSGPTIIGGLGGSGTRIVAQIMDAAGIFMGAEIDDAYDIRLWAWYVEYYAPLFKKDMNHRQIFLRQMKRFQRRYSAPFDGSLNRWLGSLMDLRDRIFHGATFKVCMEEFKKYRSLPKFSVVHYQGWGWKSPPAMHRLKELGSFYQNLKYVHVMRNGLDMAYSGNQRQFKQWAPFYGIQVNNDTYEVSQYIDFWIQVNQSVLEQAQKYLPNRFYVLNFEKLCDQPRDEIEKLFDFLELPPDRERVTECAKLVRPPSSRKRYQNHDLTSVQTSQLHVLKQMGFNVAIK